MAARIFEVRSEADLEAVCRLRFRIYVEEMGRTPHDADHTCGRIGDPLDEWAHVLAAKDEITGNVVGTVRANFLRDGEAGYYEDMYRLRSMSAQERGVSSITTRMAVAAGRRHTLAVRLATELYRFGFRSGIEFDYCDCNDPVLPFFLGLGYEKVRDATHRDFGRVHVLRLAVRDRRRLEQAGSPFLAVLNAEDQLDRLGPEGRDVTPSGRTAGVDGTAHIERDQRPGVEGELDRE